MTRYCTRQIHDLCTLTAALLVMVVVMGCSIDRVDPNDRTGGLSLRMDVRRDTDSIAIYTVHRDGSLEYAGGKSAILGATDWTGQLTDDEITKLRQLVVHEYDWFDAAFQSTNEPDTMRYTIRLRGQPGQRKITVVGANARIDPVYELLKQAAARRNKSVLDSLPQPGVETIGR